MSVIIKVTEMVTSQVILNNIVNNNWKEENNDWLRALRCEAQEAINHLGWEWWKKTETDIPQAKLEIIDCWHFLISHLVQTGYDNFEGGPNNDTDYAISKIALAMSEWDKQFVVEATEETSLNESLLYSLENLSAASHSHDDDEMLTSMLELMYHLNMDIQDVADVYLSKNALNIFRQNNGYRDGTYVKMWDGKEDNVFLDKLMSSENRPHVNLVKWLLGELEYKYKEVIKGS